MNRAARVMLALHITAAIASSAPATQPAPIPEDTIARLTDASAPDVETVRLLLQDLKAAPIVREAASRRLERYPAVAAKPAVEAFATEALAARTAILELLQSWDAPVDGIDPWEPASLTAKRLSTMRAWADLVKDLPTTAPTTLPADLLPRAGREIDRMLAASSGDEEVRAARERLARFGEPLLPEVYARLASAADDEARRRLKALRYRLVASDRLALSWPAGLEQLASGQPRDRVAALDELATKAAGADQRLLLELFGDPDPFIRERALRVLRSVGGDATSEAMTGLLRDPEPNVRAAVLNQLAEAPPPGIEPRLVEYLQRERDADLIVHAVRVLRALKSEEAVASLSDLLVHESWRVRAESIDAIHEASAALPAPKRAPTYTRLIKLLDDPDGFVVSRAVTALQDAKLAAALEPMARAAERHPEIAADVVTALAKDNAFAQPALEQLRRLATHANPSVRAAAVRGICTVAPRDCGKDVEAALRDPDAAVRAAGAAAVTLALASFRPSSNEAEVPGGAGELTWLEQFRAGTGRPKFVEAITPLLIPLLDTASPDDRAAAALALVATGDEARGMPVLTSLASDEPRFRHHLVQSLKWLLWESRLATFNRVFELGPDERERSDAIAALASSQDPRARDVLWDLIGADAKAEQLDGVLTGLRKAYFGARYYSPSSVDARHRKAATEHALARAKSGPELRRTVALALLVSSSRADAARAAQDVLDDPASGEWLRLDALQVLLISSDRTTSEELAVQRLTDPVLRKVAVPFLAKGASGVQQLRGSIYLYHDNPTLTDHHVDGQPIAVTAPKGMPTKPLVQMLSNDDAQLAAMAGYLLATTGDRSGYKQLESYWRSHAITDDQWRQLVYRAVAVLNDDSLTPALEDVYRGYEKGDWAMRQFYWTIRTMTGPNVLKLRKRIRDEVGMDTLR